MKREDLGSEPGTFQVTRETKVQTFIVIMVPFRKAGTKTANLSKYGTPEHTGSFTKQVRRLYESI